MPASARDSLAGSTSCRKCGARRIDAQLGLEATPDLYVASMVAVFREVYRVLKDDGVLFLNCGDSYFGESPARKSSAAGFSKTWNPADSAGNGGLRRSAARVGDLKPKDLCGIPWRVAFALRADGWYLRSDIIWSKPNPMPESVTDRPTKSHEYVFLLTKRARYYYNADAIAEPLASSTLRAIEAVIVEKLRKTRPSVDTKGGNQASGAMPISHGLTRNIRSVWTIATYPRSEAHFATMPDALADRCIKAGSRQDDVVLDPFCGRGTTGVCAIALGRSFVGIELNPEYVELARLNIGAVAPLLATETVGRCDVASAL
jgi:DNA modification methylase